MTFCNQCGKEVPAGQFLCDSCNVARSAPNSTGTFPSTSPESLQFNHNSKQQGATPLIKLLVGMLSFLVFLGGGLLALHLIYEPSYNDSGKDSSKPSSNISKARNQAMLKEHNNNLELFSHALELYDADHPGMSGLKSLQDLQSEGYIKLVPSVPYDDTLSYSLSVTGAGGPGCQVVISPGRAGKNGEELSVPDKPTEVWPIMER